MHVIYSLAPGVAAGTIMAALISKDADHVVFPPGSSDENSLTPVTAEA